MGAHAEDNVCEASKYARAVFMGILGPVFSITFWLIYSIIN
jgi:hypothetical protein